MEACIFWSPVVDSISLPVRTQRATQARSRRFRASGLSAPAPRVTGLASELLSPCALPSGAFPLSASSASLQQCARRRVLRTCASTQRVRLIRRSAAFVTAGDEATWIGRESSQLALHRLHMPTLLGQRKRLRVRVLCGLPLDRNLLLQSLQLDLETRHAQTGNRTLRAQSLPGKPWHSRLWQSTGSPWAKTPPASCGRAWKGATQAGKPSQIHLRLRPGTAKSCVARRFRRLTAAKPGPKALEVNGWGRGFAKCAFTFSGSTPSPSPPTASTESSLKPSTFEGKENEAHTSSSRRSGSANAGPRTSISDSLADGTKAHHNLQRLGDSIYGCDRVCASRVRSQLQSMVHLHLKRRCRVTGCRVYLARDGTSAPTIWPAASPADLPPLHWRCPARATVHTDFVMQSSNGNGTSVPSECKMPGEKSISVPQGW